MAKATLVPKVDTENTTRLGDQSPRFTKQTAPVVAAIHPDLPAHALDTAAANSKIVVVARMEGTGRMAVLATPDGVQTLPEGDPAHLLPIGTKCYKATDGQFVLVLPQEYATDELMQDAQAASLLARGVAHVVSRPL